MGAVVIGVSGDTAETMGLFKKENNLPYTLLGDNDGKVAKAFGVPTGPGGTLKAKIGGETKDVTRGVSAKRWTFVIGKDGKILSKNESVKPREDAKQAVEILSKGAR